MRYFRMDFSASTRATEEVWLRQDVALLPHTSFRTSASGRDTSVWTHDAEGEKLFRHVLDELNIKYEESDEQQVVTFLDAFFGGGA